MVLFEANQQKSVCVCVDERDEEKEKYTSSFNLHQCVYQVFRHHHYYSLNGKNDTNQHKQKY